MFSYGKPRRLIANTAQVLTKAFSQLPSSLTGVDIGAAATGSAVNNFLRLEGVQVKWSERYMRSWGLVLSQVITVRYYFLHIPIDH